jgi:hypothetical protein
MERSSSPAIDMQLQDRMTRKSVTLRQSSLSDKQKSSSTAKSPSGPSRPRTGLRALKSRVTVRGLAVLDRRTSAARALLDWRRDLLADVGGEEFASTQQQVLVELAARTKVYVDHLDGILLALPTLVNRRRKALPLLEQRGREADRLARLLGQLGLERRVKPVPSLREFLESPGPTPDSPMQDHKETPLGEEADLGDVPADGPAAPVPEAPA